MGVPISYSILRRAGRCLRTLSPVLLAVWLGACGGESDGTPAPSAPAAPTVTLAAQSASIATGAATTLTWSSTDATSCTGSGGWSGAKGVSGSESTGPLSASATYTLVCSGTGGSASSSATVTVTPSPVPTVSLAVNPATVNQGATATLTWSSTNASACTASGAWSGNKATSGTESTAALQANSSFTLGCTGAGGTVSQVVTVTVNGAAPAVTVTLTAAPTSIVVGQSTLLSWTSTNATSCAASGAWSGAKAVSGSEASGALAANGTFTLLCTGPGGSAQQSVIVTTQAPAPSAPTLQLAVNPASIAPGGSSTLVWSSANATSCVASGSWSGAKALSGSVSTGLLNATSAFSLACTGAGGTVSRSATVTVVVPAPTVSLTANPVSVVSGNAATLTWSTTNATSCTASGDWTGSKGTSGSSSTGALTSARNYTLTCQGAGGSDSATASVAILPQPTVTFAANPATISQGATSSLTWSSSNASSCTASGGWSGTKSTSGTESTSALQATASFTLSCTGAGGTAIQSVTVTVNAPSPTLTLTATPTSVTAGQTTSLSWTSTNVTGCTASGAWSGARAANGTETSGAIASNSTFTLLCTGPGGSVQKSALVTTQSSGSTLLFDDFLGSSIDSAKWTVFNRLSDQANGEVNCVIPQNISVSGGLLSGVSKFEDHVCGDSVESPKTMHYTSWQIQQAAAPFLYGTIEVRAKAPGGVGLWPCIWMLGYEWYPSHPFTANTPGHQWPQGGWGEIDIAEFWQGGRNDVNTTVHYNSPGGLHLAPLPYNATSRFMVYRLQWTAGSLIWSVDAEDGVGFRTLYTVTGASNVPNVPMFLILHTAIGGTGGGTPNPATFPQTFQFDYVRITQ